MANRIIIIFFLFYCGCSSSKTLDELEEALQMAGVNRKELELVLQHYKGDSLKREAATFLIKNMKWHHILAKTYKIDEKILFYYQYADSVYYSRIKGFNYQEIQNFMNWDTLTNLQKSLSHNLFVDSLNTPKIEMRQQSDLKIITSSFLISHIDHAFKMWRTSLFAKQLNYSDFCEYLLPYRSTNFFSYNILNKELYTHYNKYIDDSLSRSNPEELIRKLNLIAIHLRTITNNLKIDESIGLYDLYSWRKNSCIVLTNYYCNILKALGIPCAIENNVSFKYFVGQHFHCSIIDSIGNFISFSPLSSIPGEKLPLNTQKLNIYRFTFSAQRNTPYFLKNNKEDIPEFFTNPCLVDVTSHLQPTIKLRKKLPLKITSNNLVFLYTFNRDKKGIIPITWGVIKNDSAYFENVIPNTLYFPAILKNKKPFFFDTPFYVRIDSLTHAIVLHDFHVSDKEEDYSTLVVHRKFPQKNTMINRAKKMIGSSFLGANNKNFIEADTLITISKLPLPYLQDYIIDKPEAYQYYRYITSSNSYSSVEISMLEFLTERKNNYKNVMPSTPRPIFSLKDTVLLKEDMRFEKLINDSWEIMKDNPLYDGDMTTCSWNNKIDFYLEEPQIVNRIRLAPVNANNGIIPNHVYELRYWNNGWKLHSRQKAKYNFIEFFKVPINKLYWVKDKSEGKEEMPFFIKDGKQVFIYFNFLDRGDGL